MRGPTRGCTRVAILSASSTFCSMKTTVIRVPVDRGQDLGDLLDHARRQPQEGCVHMSTRGGP